MAAQKTASLGECLFFEFKARMEVNLCRLHSFASEPHEDDGTIHAGLELFHRRVVSQDVRSDAFVFQRRTTVVAPRPDTW